MSMMRTVERPCGRVRGDIAVPAQSIQVCRSKYQPILQIQTAIEDIVVDYR